MQVDARSLVHRRYARDQALRGLGWQEFLTRRSRDSHPRVHPRNSALHLPLVLRVMALRHLSTCIHCCWRKDCKVCKRVLPEVQVPNIGHVALPDFELALGMSELAPVLGSSLVPAHGGKLAPV